MDYRELLLLWAARESGVLEAVTFHAGTPDGVAEEAGVTERAARITLEAMAEQGYLKEVGGSYETTNKALGFVAKTDVRSIGSIPHQLDCLDRWFDLPETMQTGELPEKSDDPDESATSDDWTANFVGAMYDVDEATVRASVTEAVHRNPDAERVLDAGGGPGRFAKEFVRRGFDVTLLDRPEVIDIDRRFLEHEPIELVEGDVTDSLPTGFDIVFCSRLAHGLGPGENKQLLANAADALEPGGAVVLTDKVRGHADDAALFGAHMLAQTERGDTYTESQFADWFDAAGLEAFEVKDVPGTNLQALTGIAPRD
ncbi:class I SAM-dependent methyltransferase [Halorussus halophilus]|uniref:class I SAM-dependent methyltransferase n=1 Tax=Halorussus halophilus TaxID=2650975 RepID=UPI001301055B|nr:class I SAM-dependent methyltransferase [Halorussus halophilus]